MGLRYRTAASSLRMQRQIAEAKGQQALGPTPPRTTRSVSFNQLEPSARRLSPTAHPAQSRQEEEDSSRLLQRLRQALHPMMEGRSQSSQEYESLQDELLRLSQHIAQQKSQTAPELWAESTPPYRVQPDLLPDSLPFRTIKIVTSETRVIQRLDAPAADLSHYRQALEDKAPSARTLTLVAPEAAPEVPELLINAEVLLGHATANLTQQSLDARAPRSAQASIRPELALSLLDD